MRLKELREERGVSQAELGEFLGVSRQTIAAWENGDREPSVLQFSRICKLLKVSLELLLDEEHSAEPVLLFRADKRELLSNDMRRICATKAYDYANIEAIVGAVPTIPITHHLYEYDEVVIEKKALETRDWLGIEDAPLGDVLQLLEEKGLKIFEIPLDDEVSGFSAYDEDHGGVIYVNSNHRIERQYFTALHELGHMIFHKKDYIKNTELNKETSKIREKIADRFAGALLLPRDIAESELRLFRKKWIPNPVLLDMKKRYKASMRTILVRAAQVGIISNALCFKQIRAIDEKYGKKSEAGDLEKKELRRLKRMVFVALVNEEISSSKAAEILERPLYEIKEELGQWLEEGA
ncbi:helix-turn-helix domain protein [Denitrovibrio acetiphilus DSM 12809]|jgi:Zn-dependent peptidase ImmA (M78 family)/DNA-binding XRE family transcriptional regulator|uniref:Helix-turn-helix domain protein n=1 Tax=Denitrovibrio acetiphilus (strain DSM 12809 / NBRC 114555 / N2460) TaxID=522772 RepID=D4H4M8_DENA2|nr:XRE family transcriptional regulator [Denitrovibrio acetiphilus]ADD67422.1 helix-turn-helix domain protein [Denitrovibrio acetiphilus DSM 12809]